MSKKNYVCRCGNDADLSYIEWEGEFICADCFTEEVKKYAEQFPFMLAQEMSLSILHVPDPWG